MVPKRKRLHDALVTRGYSKWFAESVAYSDKPKLYEPLKDPIKVLVIMGENDDTTQIDVRESMGDLLPIPSKASRDRRDISVAS